MISLTEKVVRRDAEYHFKAQGDKVVVKGGFDPHAVYDVLRGTLTRYAYTKLENWMDAEDAVQDAYVNVLRTAKVNEFYNFGALYKIWLDRAIGNIKKERYDRQEVFIEFDDDDSPLPLEELIEGDEPSSELLMEVQARINKLLQSTNTMRPRTKHIVRLSLLFGYSNKEVASMLEIDKKTVENTLCHFKKLMKKTK